MHNRKIVDNSNKGWFILTHMSWLHVCVLNSQLIWQNDVIVGILNSPVGRHSWSYRHRSSGSEGVWAAAWAEAAYSERGVSWWKCSPSRLLLLPQQPPPASAAAVAAGSSWRQQSRLLPHNQSMRFLKRIKRGLLRSYSMLSHVILGLEAKDPAALCQDCGNNKTAPSLLFFPHPRIIY